MIKFVVKTIEPRDISHLIKDIPNLIIVKDEKHDAMDTFYRALECVDDCATVQLEDDIILCKDFYKKINDIISKYQNDVIQFFSMRKDDLTIGTRYINGSKFLMNQCIYLPIGMAKDFLKWKETSKYTNYKEVVIGAGCDTLFAYYLKDKKIKYLNYCPNLVDHMVCKSMIDSRRSSKRQSLTFIGE